MTDRSPGDAKTFSTAQPPPEYDEDEHEKARLKAAVLKRLVPEVDLEPPKIGRFSILRHVGHGGMGVVYAVYDEQLDRRVALKLVRGDARPELRTRLQREARAMAKLTHPNVVPVFEVGEHEGEPFFVMEYVKGQSLRQWLQPSRSAAEILGKFRQAGEGLAAAHDVGLVHRDFKPDNCVIDEDGRVRVLDFGLVRRGTDGEDEITEVDTVLPAPDEDAFETPLTRAGGTLGTPAYMAPEQLLGEETDARSDQFSFCVALWEALCGERPFAGAKKAELLRNVTRGKIQAPPRRMPQWLRPVLERGFQVELDQRWPSMRALLDALRRDPTRRRRRLLGGAGVVVLTAAVVGGWQVELARRRAECRADGAGMDALWNDDVRQSVHDGLLATGADQAALTGVKVMPWLERQAEGWRTARTEACMKAEVDRTWDEETLDRAVWCLEDRRMEFAAVVAALQDADARTIGNAVPAAAGLRGTDACRDASLLRRLPPPPKEGREDIQAVRNELSRARALQATGAYAGALAVAREALERAETRTWPPVGAAARLRIGDILNDTGDLEGAASTLERAYFDAARAGATEVSLAAAQRLTFVVGVRLGRQAEGEQWSRHADVALSTLPDPVGLRRAASLRNLAILKHNSSAYDEAAALFEQVLEIREQALGPDHPDVAQSLNNLATERQWTGSYDEAAELYRRALEIRERVFGAEHPLVAMTLLGLGVLHDETGRYEEAVALLQRAAAIRERALGPEHPDLALTLAALAQAQGGTGAAPEAAATLERVIAIQEKALGEEHADLGKSLTQLGNVRQAMGDYEQAIALHERARVIIERSRGPDSPMLATALDNIALDRAALGSLEDAAALHEQALAIREKAAALEEPEAARTLANLGQMRLRLGAGDEAARHFERALGILERTVGPDHPEVAFPLVGLARVALAQNRATDALPLAERAVKLLDAAVARPLHRADALLLLAHALAETGEEESRWLPVALEAREAGRKAGRGGTAVLADVEGFLQAHAPEVLRE